MKMCNEIIRFSEQMYLEEKSENTVKKYVRDVKVFFEYASKESRSSKEFMNKSFVVKYKSFLREKYNIVSANSMIASINAFFKFIDRLDLCVKQFKIQKSAFCDKSKELSYEEYNHLVETALEIKNERLALVLQTICATGIRISELQYITVDAVGRTCLKKRKNEIKSSSHSKYRYQYHILFATKYRRQEIYG